MLANPVAIHAQLFAARLRQYRQMSISQPLRAAKAAADPIATLCSAKPRTDANTTTATAACARNIAGARMNRVLFLFQIKFIKHQKIAGRGCRASARGMVIVESALVFLTFLMLLLGTIEFGRAWFSYNLLTHAVREGARLAAVKPALQTNDEAVVQRINDILQDGGLIAVSASVNFQSPLQTGRIIRIRAEVNFSPVVALWLSNQTDPITFPLRVDFITRYEV